MSLNVGSQICLHGVKVFDKAALTPRGIAGWYGRAAAVPMLVKVSEPLVRLVSL